ncbi:phage tail protein, partial [Photorhabdus temperata]
ALKSNLALAIKNALPEVRDATLTEKGIIQLSNATDSTSERLAATPRAVKYAYDLANTANNNANTKLAKSQNGADIPNKSEFIKNLGLAETVQKANNAYPKSGGIVNGYVDATGYISGKGVYEAPGIRVYSSINKPSPGELGAYTITEVDNNFARGNVEVVNTMSAYPRINFFPQRGKESRGYFAIEASLNDDNYQSIYVYHRNSAGKNIYVTNFPEKDGILATLDDINAASNIPTGVPLPYPHRYTPVGYLTCNGQAFDKSLYPKLAEAYPAGRVPDLRGEFIRGWDDSRGVDPGRVCGSWQGDAIRNITGYVTTDRAQISGSNGAFSGPLMTAGANISGQVLQIGRDFNFDASRVVPTANENRPRNIAFNYIVRAA